MVGLNPQHEHRIGRETATKIKKGNKKFQNIKNSMPTFEHGQLQTKNWVISLF